LQGEYFVFSGAGQQNFAGAGRLLAQLFTSKTVPAKN
jgi:hypothetical protein